MRAQAEEARRANGGGKSEGGIVPMKPGNSGGGKACRALMAGGLSIIWTLSQAYDVNSTASQPRNMVVR